MFKLSGLYRVLTLKKTVDEAVSALTL
jgi:hypothetical protein